MHELFVSSNKKNYKSPQQPNTRSAVTNQDKLWTSPVPYVLDKGLGKYNFSCITTQNINNIYICR